jgi:hypothetical protein
VTNPKATITTDKLAKDNLSLPVEVSQEMLDAFKAEGLLGKPVSGFIILTGMKMTGFVPTTRDHKDTDTFDKFRPEQVLQDYNKEFEAFVTSGSSSKQK